MKRIIALIIAIVLVLSCSGCQKETVSTETESWVEGGETTEGTNTGDNNVENKPDNQPVITDPMKADLKGATITIYDASDQFSTDKSNKTRKSYADILASVQKSLNCKFKVKVVDDNKLNSLVLSSAASGKALCNIICPQMQFGGSFIAAGVVADLTRVSSMDLSKSYMNRLNVLNASALGGAKYAVTSENGARTWATFYNKRILKEMGYKENYLYDLVDSKKWNYDNARKLGRKAMKDLDGKAGMSVNDQWGFLWVDSSMMTSHAIINSGGSLIKHNKNNYLQYNMTDSRVISSINLIHEFYKKDGTTCLSISNYKDRISAFAAGHSLFLFSNIHHAPTISSNMADDFGVLPIPMMKGSSNYKTALDWNVGIMMIPAGLSSKDQYNSGAVIQAILSQCDKNVAVMRDEYTNRYLCDSKSGKNMVLAINQDTANVEAFYCATNESILSGTYRPFWNLISGKISSVVTEINATKKNTVKAIEELNATAKKNKS